MSPFSSCACSVAHLSRIERRPWMRLFGWLRAYQCANCGKVQLLPKADVDKAMAEHAVKAARAPGAGRDSRARAAAQAAESRAAGLR